VIVSKFQARAIQTGKATTLRRPIDERGYATRNRRGRTEVRKPTVHQPSDRIAIRTTIKGDALCHVLITGLRKERLGRLTFDDARAEGFRTTTAFKTHWVRRHDAEWIARREQEAVLPDGTIEQRVMADDALVERFDSRHAEMLVWVLSIEVERDTPKLLAAQSDELYVDTPARAMPGEPEAINVEMLRPVWSKRSTARHVDAVRNEMDRRRRRSIVERVRQAPTEQLEAIERQLNGEAA
jgi:hypothetical protein